MCAQTEQASLVGERDGGWYQARVEVQVCILEAKPDRVQVSYERYKVAFQDGLVLKLFKVRQAVKLTRC